jgi:hypothetical protein
MNTAHESHLDVRGLSPAKVESKVLEAYKSGDLGEEQVRRLLGLKSRFDVHALLKERGMYLNYSLEDWAEDVKFSESWLSSQTPRR